MVGTRRGGAGGARLARAPAAVPPATSRSPLEAAVPAPAPAKPRGGGDSRVANKELQKIERQLDRIGEKEARLHAEIADNATDFERVGRLDAELRALRGERDDLEMRWLELADDDA